MAGTNDDFFGASLLTPDMYAYSTGGSQLRQPPGQVRIPPEANRTPGITLDPDGTYPDVPGTTTGGPTGNGVGGTNNGTTTTRIEFNNGGAVVPTDLTDIRKALSDYFLKQLQGSPAKFGGSLDIGTPEEWQKGLDTYKGGVNNVSDMLASFLGGGSQLSKLASTSDATDITGALDAIRQKTMGDMEDMKAQMMEKFGSWGLGRSSDVNEYIARGTSRGLADMNAQQTQLMASVMDSAKNRQLTAAQTLSQGGVQGAGILGGITSQYADAIGGVGTNKMNLQAQNLARQYSDFLRLQSPQDLQAATGFATSFPPVRPAIPNVESSGSGIGAAAIGGIGSVLGSLLPFLLSDKNVKYDVRPTDSHAVLNSLVKLPISTWKYKGSDVSHIGPMAQDFQSHFGVGDGTTINLVDIMGVLIASQQAMAQKFVGSGKSEGARG